GAPRCARARQANHRLYPAPPVARPRDARCRREAPRLGSAESASMDRHGAHQDRRSSGHDRARASARPRRPHDRRNAAAGVGRMTTRIGLAVGRGAVRAVMVRDYQVVWAGEVPLPSYDALQATVTALLATTPPRRWLRPVVHAAIGPHGAQVRHLVGLPEITDADALSAIVR